MFANDRPLTDAEAADIAAGAILHQVLAVATTSADPAEATIARAQAAGRTVLDAVAETLGPGRGRRVRDDALGLLLGWLHRGATPA